ncbi:GntR family transcriptional regulator [Paenibacillus glycanilyticus]|uniref:GntR family transcriptional regulator n=1 Tax=Paenibacillus glycanilyticus TaxID=126569 RepID=A0ABQ6GHU7_9BACL|nr:GntR family transcriptional regulator [Paenibacillus glycanilyticus]GLX68883.1 GntR family transcriptional regulator [Paenibacillus glycanilyticus]
MWLPIQINEQSAEPLYYQIEVQLRALIVSGQLEEGTLLPSIREFAQLLKCSVITVRRVYQDLENEGLLRTKQGTGTYVARIEQNAMESYRLDAVTEALEAAVDAGKLVQCTREELAQLFQDVLERKFGG